MKNLYPDIYYIYKTTNTINNKIYVGKHKTIDIADGYIGSGLLLTKAINKYGIKNFISEIIEYCTKENVNEKEIFWIKELNSTNKNIGYNIHFGGQGGNTYGSLSPYKKEKFKENVSKALKGIKKTDNHKLKLSKANINNYQGGQRIPFYIDNIFYESIGDASKKLDIPPKTIHNRLNSKNIKYSNYRYKDKTIQKIIPKSSKRIMIDNISYNSIEDAVVKTGISRITIYRELNGMKTKTFRNKKVSFI